MAIAKIKKLEIIGLQNEKDQILSFLQKLGILELIKVRDSTMSSVSPEISMTEKSLAELQEAISFLDSLKEKSGILEGLVKLKPLVYKHQFHEVVSSFDYQGLLKELTYLRNNLKYLFQQREKLLQESHNLSGWQNLSLQLDQIGYTRFCGLLSGISRSQEFANLIKDSEKQNIYLFYEIVNQKKNFVYLLIIYKKEDYPRLELLLKNHHFNFVSLPHYKGTVKDRLLEIKRELLNLDEEIENTKQRISQFAKEQFKLMVVYDYLANVKKKQEAGLHLVRQRFSFVLTAWIRDRDTRYLKKALTSKFKNVAIFISEPKADEDIPIALENKPAVQAFEVVTNLYGQPAYKGVDPTGILAPFFAFSFGFCLLDAGYGFLLAIMTMFFLRKKQVSQTGRNFLKLFLFMGLVTIFAGTITGNFFGDLISRLPEQFKFLQNIQKHLTLFDVINDSLLFLGLTLVFGFIQIWTAVFVRFLKHLHKERFTALILDLPTLCVQTSLLILVLIYSQILPLFMLKYVLGLIAISAILIIYYQWKSNPNISLKIFWSIFGIYSIIAGNFLADTLSFSRIFALGLTSGLLGMAINTMLFPKWPITGIFNLIVAIVAVLALFLAHIINLAISILGGYVHTSRLQYLEFFTKFFESGGRPFKPFKEETKYIFLTDEA